MQIPSTMLCSCSPVFITLATSLDRRCASMVRANVFDAMAIHSSGGGRFK